MYAHIAEAEMAIGPHKSGVVILETGYTDVITSTLTIGVTKHYGIDLVMEPGSRIVEKIMDGSPGIVILDGSAMECEGGGPSGTINGEQISTCMVVTESSANMSAMVAGNTILDQKWQDVLGLHGVTFIAGAATLNAVADFGATGAPSAITYNNFFGGPRTQHVVYLHNNFGGGVIWMGNQLRGGSETLGSLYYITGDELTGYQGVTGAFTIEGGEASCPGPNAPAIVIDGNPDNRAGNWQGVMHLNVHALWSQTCEGSGPPYPPAYVVIKDASYVHFYDQQFSSQSPSLFSVTESNPGQVNSLLFDNITMSCVQINCTGQNFIQDTTLTGYTHPAPTWTNNALLYGYEGFIMHDGAGRWTYAQGPVYTTLNTGSFSASGTTTLNQANIGSLTLKGNGSAGSTTYQDASAGYAWRVSNGGAINLDFGANGFVNSWIESYQNGTTTGKPLYINPKFHGPVYFGGAIGLNGVGNIVDNSGNVYAGTGTVPIYRCTGKISNGMLTSNPAPCAGSYVDTGLRTK